MKRIFVLLLIASFCAPVYAAPLNVLTDYGDSFNAVIVEKDRKKLHVVRVSGNGVTELKTVNVMTGRVDGDKRVEGDAKTPEGVYHVTGFLSPQRLTSMYGDMAKIYGYGAFPISYPNRLDELLGKSGGGIWIHGVENNRQEPSTKGCVAFANNDVRAISPYLSAGTPVVITRTAINGTSSQYRNMFKAVKETVLRYLKAWGENDYDSFRDAYSRNFRSGDGRSLNSYLAYKKGLVSSYPIRELSADKFRVFYESENEAVAQFNQYYTAGNMSSYGQKTLYMRREGGSMRIVAEDFRQTGPWRVNPTTLLVKAETPKKPTMVAMAEPVKKQEQTPSPAQETKKSSSVALPEKRVDRQKALVVAMTALPKPPRAEKYIKPDVFAQQVEDETAAQPATSEEPKTAEQTPAAQQKQPEQPVLTAVDPTAKPAVTAPAPTAVKPAVQETAQKKPVEVVLADNSRAHDEDRVREFVGQWASAWESKDIDRYIALYSDGFHAGRMDVTAWKKDKGRKFASLSDIQVEVADVSVTRTGEERYAVTFQQRYKGDTYKDTGDKTLVLDGTSGRLLIVSEQYRHTSAPFKDDLRLALAPSQAAVPAEVVKPAAPKPIAMAKPVETPKPAEAQKSAPTEVVILPAPAKTAETPKPVIAAKPAETPKQTVKPEQAQPVKPQETKPAPSKVTVLSETVLEPKPMTAIAPEKTSPRPVSATASMAGVNDFIASWKSAWEARDIDKYIAMYGDTFRSGRMDVAAWKADKQRKFARLSSVTVGIENMDVTVVSDHMVDVTFKQIYTGDRYSDTGIKTLRLDSSSGEMRIVSETWRAK